MKYMPKMRYSPEYPNFSLKKTRLIYSDFFQKMIVSLKSIKFVLKYNLSPVPNIPLVLNLKIIVDYEHFLVKILPLLKQSILNPVSFLI